MFRCRQLHGRGDRRRRAAAGLAALAAAVALTAASQSRHLISQHAAVVAGVILIALLLAPRLAAAVGRRRKARVTRSPHSGHAPAPLAQLTPGPPPGGSTPSAVETIRFPALNMPDHPGGQLAGPAPGAISGPARHSVSPARHRVIPVVLASSPDAPWSFTAQPSRYPDESLHSVIA
jgi:hypothetical protein